MPIYVFVLASFPGPESADAAMEDLHAEIKHLDDCAPKGISKGFEWDTSIYKVLPIPHHLNSSYQRREAQLLGTQVLVSARAIP